MTSLLESELNHIVKIGIDHRYNPQIIHKLIEKFNSAQLTRHIYRKISYIQTKCERLMRIFNTFGIHLVAYPTKNLFTAITKKEDPLPILFHSGVYEILVQLNTRLLTSCFGMTKRWLFDRVKEHKRDIKFNRQSTALCRLAFKGNIMTVHFDNVKIISRYSIPLKCLIRESIEISLRKGEVYNDNISFQVCNVWLNFLKETQL